MLHHRAALAFDWRARFGLPLRDLGGLSWNEAWDLTLGLLRDPTSHTAASVAGFAFVPPPAMTALADWIEVYANSKRGKNTVPIRITRPWLAGGGPTSSVPAPPSAESLERRSRLAERLGLPT